MKKFDIASVGELLVDMTPLPNSKKGTMCFEANAGGAPCNVLAMAAKLGANCAFIGKVGKDTFGSMLVGTLDKLGIDTAGIVCDTDIPTTLAVIAFDEKNDRSFSFYRNPGADQMLREQEVNTEIVKNSSILHFGTMSLTKGESRAATMFAVETAKANGSIVSFDPNIRMFLWNNEAELREMLKFGLSKCDVLKVSEEEAQYYSCIEDPEKAVESIIESYPNIKVVFLTLGEKGCKVFFRKEKLYVEAIPQNVVLDTTGAGDAFCGTCLYYIAKCGLAELSMDEFYKIAIRANAAGSIVTGRLGSMSIMPSKEEIEEKVFAKQK